MRRRVSEATTAPDTGGSLSFLNNSPFSGATTTTLFFLSLTHKSHTHTHTLYDVALSSSTSLAAAMDGVTDS